jgi:hypothetical protein
MIKYSLKCRNGHEFESWFQNGAAFDDQATRGLIACPVCADTMVSKAIMAPALVAQSERRPRSRPPQEETTPVALIDPAQEEQRALLRALRRKILTEADDVGDRFPDEARRIHEGLTPERAIHGRATIEEAKALVQEGIGVLPIPTLPEDLN